MGGVNPKSNDDNTLKVIACPCPSEYVYCCCMYTEEVAVLYGRHWACHGTMWCYLQPKRLSVWDLWQSLFST